MSDAVPGRLVRAAPSPMWVQSLHRSVVNITTADGLLAVASLEAGGLPNGILVDVALDWRMIGLEPGMVVLAGDTGIRVPGANLAIPLGAARHWSPRLGPGSGVGAAAAATTWRQRAVAARSIARSRAATDGFGALLRNGPIHAGQSETVAVARPIVTELTAMLAAGDRGAAARAAGGLIGLGPGLTPSGDDTLVGIEAALHALGSPLAGFVGSAIGDVTDRTTALAATLLRHAAAGEFAERLHLLLGALVGPDEAAIAPAVERAVAWGATSGTDCLVGVLIGLDLASGVGATAH